MKKEKRVFDRQNEAMKYIPNRREREEIDILNKEVKELEEKIKKIQNSNKITLDRLKKRVNEARNNNDELIQERDAISQALAQLNQNSEISSDKHADSNYADDHEGYQVTTKIDSSRVLGNYEMNQPSNTYQNHNQNQNREERKEENKQDVDMSNLSHSPQFGVRSSKMRETDDHYKAHHYRYQDEGVKNFESGHDNVSDVQNSYEDNKVHQDNEVHEENNEFENDDLDPSDYDMKFLPQYHNDSHENKRIVQENINSDGKVVRWYANKK